MDINDIIKSIIKTIQDLYLGFSEWVNTSKDANVIAWVSTVFFSAFAVFILKIPQRVLGRLHKCLAVNSEKDIEEKYTTIESDVSSSYILSTTIPVPIDLIGRDGDYVRIRQLLDQNNSVFIHASGGVGKTAIALKIANDIKKEIISGNSQFKHIAWITSTGDLKNDIIGLDIPELKSVKSTEEKYRIACSFLEQTTTFLVIDNMDDSPSKEDADVLNTISGRTKILITSRADISVGKPYALKDLDPDSALLLFYRHYRKGKNLTIARIKKQNDYFFAQNIVRATTYNTLFIELIAKMAYADYWKLDALWKELEKDIFCKESKHTITTIHGDGKLLVQIQNLYKMSKLSPIQQEIMSFIAIFPPEHSVFFDVFEWAGFEDDEVDNLGELQRRGWIERSDEGYLIHTMVKGSVKQQGKAFFDEDRYEKLINELANTDQYMPVDKEYTVTREYIIIPETICRLLAKQRSETVVALKLYSNMAGVYHVQGNYTEALKYYNLALLIAEEKLGKDHPDTAATYHNIAGVYADLGNYTEALKYYKLALPIVEEKLGKDHPDTAATYHNIAGVYAELGNYTEALKYYNLALPIVEEKLGKDHPDTATAYTNIAGVYRNQGNYAEALKYYKLALPIIEEKLGEDYPDTATQYHNIAGLYELQGNYTEALKYYNQALSIREEKLGKDHPFTAITYNNMAGVYKYQGNYAEALKYYNLALSITVEKLGKDHPFTAFTYNNMAGVYGDLGNYAEALKYYNLALSIREEKLGKDHPDTAATYYNIAGVYAVLGNYTEALKYYNLALPITEEKLGKDHPDTAKTYNGIAGVYKDQGNYADALKYYNLALSIQEEKLGKDHLDTATTYNDMAGVYKDQGNYADALKYYNLALSVREGKLGKDHPSTATTYAKIAEVYRGQGNYAEALKHFRLALSIFEEKLGRDHLYIATTYCNMGFLFNDLVDYESAKDCFERALAVFENVLEVNHPNTKIAKKCLEATIEKLNK